MSLPASALHHRDRRCAVCVTPCALQADHADPCAACPLPKPEWHAWDCGKEPAPDAPKPTATRIVSHNPSDRLLHRFRAYRRAKFPLVDTATRHLRRDACAACEFRKPSKHSGLYGCSERSCGCGGGDELRMIFKAVSCSDKKWPK